MRGSHAWDINQNEGIASLTGLEACFGWDRWDPPPVGFGPILERRSEFEIVDHIYCKLSSSETLSWPERAITIRMGIRLLLLSNVGRGMLCMAHLFIFHFEAERCLVHDMY